MEYQASNLKVMTSLSKKSLSLSMQIFGDILVMDHLLGFTRSKLEFFIRKYPSQILHKLFQVADLKQLIEGYPTALHYQLLCHPEEVLADLSSSGVRSIHHPLFEILCRLLCFEKPELLMPFILAVSNLSKKLSPATGKHELRTKFTRALLCVPSLSLFSSSESVKPSLDLLCSAKKSVNAVQLLLVLGNWEAAIQLVESVTTFSYPTEHLELFHLLLVHCLRTKQYSKCSKIWKYMPKSFGILELVQLIQQESPRERATDILCSSVNDFSVVLFRAQFQNILQGST